MEPPLDPLGRVYKRMGVPRVKDLARKAGKRKDRATKATRRRAGGLVLGEPAGKRRYPIFTAATYARVQDGLLAEGAEHERANHGDARAG